MKFSINFLVSLFLFTLISACSSGGDSAVPVTPAPTSLSASLATIALGDSVDLTAVIAAGATGSIDNGVGSVTSDTPVSVSPTETTTYTLTVTKSDGSTETATVTVTVVIVTLDTLSIIDANLDQTFQTNQPDYTASVGFLSKSIHIKAIATDPGASITVNDVAVGADNLTPLVSLVVGVNPAINIVVTHTGVTKTYTLVVTRTNASTFAQEAYIKASNTDVATSDEFGYSVSVSGDTLAVGARYEDSSFLGINNTPDNNDDAAVNAGAVYVFTRSGATWTQQAYIKSPNPQTGDWFGFSVALYGETLAVGATQEASSTKGINTTDDNDPASNSGAVYVYTRSSGVWTKEAYR
ncbi:MAG: cadherin-like beta sandwich domain-containing protein, partial [Gammaproteobacteria bacterium]|nr:cadherin-like beta sandwich domain-containing protein [Gammaproteobacteria bacterium]